MTGRSGPILTLEPLIDAVRRGVERQGWTLSGLQKTTSHQFEGRWAGDSSRSAYLFFHRPEGPEWASVDVFLDETSQGRLVGNLALVVDLRSVAGLGDLAGCLGTLGHLSTGAFPEDAKTPVTLRLRLEDGAQAPGDAESEVRFKLRIPRTAVDAGEPAVEALASATVEAFEAILSSPVLAPFLDAEA